MKIEIIATDKLRNWDKNPREIEPKQMEALKGYMVKHGLLDPLIVDGRDGSTVLGGNMRLRAARELGWKEVECNVVEVESDDEALEIALLDNNQFGDYVKGQLIELIRVSDIKLEDFKIDLKPVGLDTLIPQEVGEDDFEVPDEDEIETDIQLGDIFTLGDHKLMCGDATKIEDVEKLMGGQKADMVFTDPPYGVGRGEGFEGFEGFGGFGRPIARKKYKRGEWDEKRVSVDFIVNILSLECDVVMFGGNFYTDSLPVGTHWIVWDKKQTMPTFGDCELAWTNIDRKSIKKYEIVYNGLIGKEKERFHPTQKPLKLAIDILTDYTDTGNLIVDIFGGSGSTLIACEQTDRKCYMMEIDPKYCEVICQRWEKLTGGEREKING